MDPLFWKSFVQGIVQGLTEFLPISSTGHMILFDHFLAMGKPFSDMFEVVIQLAIALGHPYSATGINLAAKAAAIFKHKGGERCVITFCVGGGQGVACLFENCN